MNDLINNIAWGIMYILSVKPVSNTVFCIYCKQLYKICTCEVVSLGRNIRL